MTFEPGYHLKKLGPGDGDYKYVTSKMIKTFSPHHQTGIPCGSYDILEAYKVLNSSLWVKYKERRREINCDLGSGGAVVEKHFFHGSPYCKKITQEGFDTQCANANGMFGKGIYFAENSSKSIQYAYGLNQGCSRHRNISCYECPRHMLLCRVALGNPLKLTHERKSGDLPAMHHSVHGVPSSGGLAYPEYVVYNQYQAYPGFLIEYKILQGMSIVQQFI